MAHTIKVIAGGLGLLALCLLVGRMIGGPNPTLGMIEAIKTFIPLWLIGAGINMWVGVTKAGYSIREEIPFFLVVFAIPAAMATFVWWRLSQG
jgi:hypothetical protein